MIAVVTYTALCADALMMLYETVGHSSGQEGPQDWHKKWDPKTQCLTPVSMTLSHLFTVCLTFDMSDEPMPAPDTRNSISLQLLRAGHQRTTQSLFHSHNKSICLQSFGVKYNLYDLLSTHVTNHLWKQFTISI